MYTAMQELFHGNGLVDLPGLVRRMLSKRRGILAKKEQLLCGYQAVLYAAEEYLKSRESVYLPAYLPTYLLPCLFVCLPTCLPIFLRSCFPCF